MIPPPELLDAWNLQVTGDLGGRLNRHWQVLDRGEKAVLRRWHGPEAEVDYELNILKLVGNTNLGLPMLRRSPQCMAGARWSLHDFVSGEPASRGDARIRGRWLAELHSQWRDLALPSSRPGWSAAWSVVSDPASDSLLNTHGATRPADVRLYRWHLDRIRATLTEIQAAGRPQILIHGDFTPWNIRVQGGVWTGLLDFEFTRPADFIEDFALAWRGVHDNIVRGYADHTALSEEDTALLTPLWWAHLLGGALRDLERGIHDGGWTARKLRVRSPLMGGLATPYPD